MAKILPFRALRPAPGYSGEVATQSYDSYEQEERETLISGDNKSFLKVIGGAYKTFPKSPKSRYKAVRKAFEKAKENGTLIKDQLDAIYIYRITTLSGYKYLGTIACLPISDYDNNTILKHEDTLTARETIFETYLDLVNFNAEPVLVSYPDHEGLNELLQTYCQLDPTDDFEFSDGSKHTIWAISKPSDIVKIIQQFQSITQLYIADGHHRAASSSRLAASRGDAASQQFMTYLIPESQLQILEFNRYIKNLNGHTEEYFLEQLAKFFEVKLIGTEMSLPKNLHQFTLYLNKKCFELNVIPRYFENQPNALEALDVYILNSLVFEPLLNILDLKMDDRVQFAPGHLSISAMQNTVDQGKYKAVFGLFPIAAQSIRLIADQHLTLPPKSTYIQPKLLSGLTIYELL